MRQGTENMPTKGVSVRLEGNSGISEVDYHHFGSGKAATMQLYGDAEAGICGGDEDRYESAAQTGTGIFKNAFADLWTTDMDAHGPEDKWVHTEIIQHIIDMCGFSADSLMVRYMDQQQWSELEHVVMTKLDEIKDFKTYHDDGFTICDGGPMIIHQKKLQAFLLFYKWKMLWEEEGPTEDEVLEWTPCEFNAYCKSKEFHDDYANYLNPHLSKPMKSSNRVAGNSAGVAGAASASGITTAVGPMTAEEFLSRC
jgi:hypothetical protein